MSIPNAAANDWAPWRFDEKRRLARYVCEDAEETFPLAEEVSWRSGGRIDRTRAVRGIYDHLAQLKGPDGLYYALDPYHPERDQQEIRSPRTIAESRRGTCLDLTLLFAGLCLSQRLCPIVVLTAGHAFALVALQRDPGTETAGIELPLAKGVVEDADLLRQLVANGAYVAIECTGFVSRLDGASTRGPLSFDEAIAAGRQALDAELRFALDVATARYRLGEPGQPDRQGMPLWRTLSRHWSQWEEAQRARIRFQEDVRPNVLDSPAVEWLRQLLSSAWHEKIQERIEALAEIETGEEEIRELQKRFANLNLSSNYPLLLAGLQQELRSAARVLHDRIAELERRTGLTDPRIPEGRLAEPEAQGLLALRQLRKAVFALQEEVREPRFARCLLVAGDWGAGKTHFATLDAERVASCAASPLLLLRLEPGEKDAPLRDQLVAALQRITGYGWPSLAAFQHYLAHPEGSAWSPDPQARPPFLVVVLDDYEAWLRDRPDLQKELQDLILDTTDLHSFYWVLLARHAAFADVAPGNGRWSQLAWLPAEPDEVPRIGPWIDLDAVDREERLGIEILRQESDLRPEMEAGAPAERDLANPRIAWTVLDHREELPVADLAGLNFIDFAQRFWEGRKSTLATAPLEPQSPERLVKYAVRAMLDKLGVEPRRVGHDMEVQADSALGSGYYRGWPEQRERYERQIEDLAQAPAVRDRRLAFYLIRHTRPAGGQKRIAYDAAFRPALRHLFLDREPEIRSLVEKFYDTFRVNLGGDLAALEKERAASQPAMSAA